MARRSTFNIVGLFGSVNVLSSRNSIHNVQYAHVILAALRQSGQPKPLAAVLLSHCFCSIAVLQFFAMPPRPRGPARKLTPQQFTYFCLGLPIGFIAVTVGIVGLVIIWDADKTLAVSKTDFADLWRRAVQHNPFIQAFMLNFGAIGFGYSIVRLLEHRQALKAEEEQQQQQRRRQQQRLGPESRKDQ